MFLLFIAVVLVLTISWADAYIENKDDDDLR